MNLGVVAIVGIVVMVLFIIMGMNIGLSMIMVALLGLWYSSGLNVALGLAKTVTFATFGTYSFSVIPLFILMGNFMFYSGISSGLFNTANKWLGGIRGGTAMASIAACAGFGAICGSLAATTATMSRIAIPEMKRQGYATSLAAGTLAAGGTLGVLIPPSTSFVLYGIIAEVSIGRLFAAGVVPGIVCALTLCCVVFIWTKVDPSAVPPRKRFPLREKLLSIKDSLGVVIVFIIVIGGMFAGIFSVTEAAGVGAFLGFVCMVVTGNLNWKNFKNVMKDTIETAAMALLVVLGAMYIGYFLAITQMPQNLANWIGNLDVSPYIIILAILILYAFLGCIMDGLAIILLTTPIFLPIIRGLGFDAIWWGVVLQIIMNLGAITPPVGLSAYVVSGVCKEVTLPEAFKGAMPMCIAICAAEFFIVAFPRLALWFPGLFY